MSRLTQCFSRLEELYPVSQSSDTGPILLASADHPAVLSLSFRELCRGLLNIQARILQPKLSGVQPTRFVTSLLYDDQENHPG